MRILILMMMISSVIFSQGYDYEGAEERLSKVGFGLMDEMEHIYGGESAVSEWDDTNYGDKSIKLVFYVIRKEQPGDDHVKYVIFEENIRFVISEMQSGFGDRVKFTEVGDDYVGMYRLDLWYDRSLSGGKSGGCRIRIGGVYNNISVIMHEFGHFFELGHSYGATNPIMYHFVESGSRFTAKDYDYMYSLYLESLEYYLRD